MSETDSQNATEQSNIVDTTDIDDDHEYRCPYCNATYSDEEFARVHITRANDENHANRNGQMPEEQIEVINQDGDIIKTLSRRPDEIDLTDVTIDDLPDSLSPKRKHIITVATQNPNEDTRRRLAEMTEQRLRSNQYEVEPPSERTVGQALDDFYHPHLDDGTDVESLSDLAITQQAIVVTNLAQPNASPEDIADLVGCSRTYPRQVTNDFKSLINRLESKVADGKPLQAIIEDQLSEENITALVEKNLVTELDDIDFEAIRGSDTGENPSLGPETNSNTALSSDSTQKEEEYDPDRWGSPVDNSTKLQAAPDSPFGSSAAKNGENSSEKENDENSSEFEAVKIGGESANSTQDEADPSDQIPRQDIKELKRNVAFVREAMAKTEQDGAEYARSIALQVEERCYQLLQSEF
jgi:hypothetical protein